MKQEIHSGIGLILLCALATSQASGRELPIQKLRVMLEQHETSLSPLLLDISIYNAPSGQRQQLLATCRWTHLNHDQFLKCVDYQTEHAASDRRVIGYDSGFWGEIHPQNQVLRWLPPSQIPHLRPAELGLRWQGRRISQWLRPEWARIGGEKVLRGRRAWRVDIRLPDARSFANPIRLWIDQERGIPLQIATLNASDKRRYHEWYLRIMGNLHYTQRPDGIWLPWQGNLIERTKRSYLLEVDLNSIRRDAEAFPEGLFTRETVQNAWPLPRPSEVDDSNQIGPGSIMPRDLWSPHRPPEEIARLATLRAMVQETEAALATIEFIWATELDHTGKPSKDIHPVPSEAAHLERYRLQTGHYVCYEGQHGCQKDLFLPRDRWNQAIHYVWNHETVMQKRSPAGTVGVIDYASQFHWDPITPLAWTMRVFADNHRLSDLLIPELARIHEAGDTINRWPTTVVDVRHPDTVTDYARLWLDVESGLPLQIDTYQVIDWPRLIHTERITDVSLVTLPIGAWLPIKAKRIQYRTVPKPHERMSGMAIDFQSVVTDANAIATSLLAAPFRSSEMIYNAITDRYERYTPPTENAQVTRPERRPVFRRAPKKSQQVQEVNEIPAVEPLEPNVTQSIPAAIASSTTEPNQEENSDVTTKENVSPPRGMGPLWIIALVLGAGVVFCYGRLRRING